MSLPESFQSQVSEALLVTIPDTNRESAHTHMEKSHLCSTTPKLTDNGKTDCCHLIKKKGSVHSAQKMNEPVFVKLYTSGDKFLTVQERLEELQRNKASKESESLLNEGVAKLINLVDNQHCDEDALFEESFNNREHIKNLPMEEACWTIGEIELLIFPNGKILRLMALMSISLNSVSQTLLTSIASKDTISYKEQAMRLFYHACLHPHRKKPRRPQSILLRSTPDAEGVELDVAEFGVYFIDSMRKSKKKIRKFSNLPEHISFHMCCECGLRGTIDMFQTCPHCEAVLYCDEECRSKAWQDKHSPWCEHFKTFMKMESCLADLPFEFAKNSTSRDFRPHKLQELLIENDVYKKGLWRRECPSSNKTSCIPFGELDNEEKPFVFPLEGAVLQSPPNGQLPDLDKPLKTWGDYYSYRGFWLDSPVAGVLHYPLTLYWIITHCLSKHYSLIFENIKLNKCIHIHLIGVEKEAEMFHSFLECARLLAPLEVHIHLFGNKISKRIHNYFRTQENLTFHVHYGLYHESKLHMLPRPHLAVGFNAGLSAYPSFIRTIETLVVQKTPFYCTDYCYHSIAHSNQALVKSKVGLLVKPVINPFRSPFRITSPESHLPCYSNGFVFCIKPMKTKRSKKISNVQ
ncbi:zinc finger MYND domain-containing protein 15-like [Physella acuta]|uniref:zinc finger MYND domain-containing protein 15-like n=1 Tax=Physella acuta TaxID=109671 RepID=UPI0027DD55C0|nr:zinc finger MYND domain-containing protein 15-like [Physella acuta]XP_059170993.1 zinc finger MYND domain-containing protein 15-like [Physella acuta]